MLFGIVFADPDRFQQGGVSVCCEWVTTLLTTWLDTVPLKSSESRSRGWGIVGGEVGFNSKDIQVENWKEVGDNQPLEV